MKAAKKIKVDDDINALLQTDEKVNFRSKEVALRLYGGLVGTEVYATTRQIILKHPKWAGMKSNVVNYPYENVEKIQLRRGVFSTSIFLKLRQWGAEKKICTIPKSDAEMLNKIVQNGIAMINETMVFEYIVQHGGEIDVDKCARELKISKGDVEEATKSLVRKGKLEAG